MTGFCVCKKRTATPVSAIKGCLMLRGLLYRCVERLTGRLTGPGKMVSLLYQMASGSCMTLYASGTESESVVPKN